MLSLHVKRLGSSSADLTLAAKEADTVEEVKKAAVKAFDLKEDEVDLENTKLMFKGKVLQSELNRPKMA